MSEAGIVIVGAGQAGFQAAASLRETGFPGRVTLVGEEPGLPYQRPPLSKAYLAGKTDAAGLALRAPSFLDEHRITYRPGVRATRIDRIAGRLELSDGPALAYDHLVLATGSRNRVLSVPGADLAGIHQLRTLADADALRTALVGAASIAVIGAGFIGLEFASVCAARGLAVTVIEAAARPMGRAVSAETAGFFRAAHEAAGVRFLFEAGIVAIEGSDGRAKAVQLRDGTRVDADLVLVGIGILPKQDLAADAGLAVGNGIQVDSVLLTGDEAISAIGDCALFPTRFGSGAPVRIESVQNAVDQARCLAARICGRAAPYDAVPWFWSDQGSHKLQIAGLSTSSDDSVVRPGTNGFSVFRFFDGHLRAVESVNSGSDHMAARRILAQNIALTPDQAADPACDLKRLALKTA